MSTCGHCLTDFEGPMSGHTCEPIAHNDRIAKLAAIRRENRPNRKRATENLANALAASPRFSVQLAGPLVVNLAAALELANGHHLEGTYRERQTAIAQASRDYCAYKMSTRPYGASIRALGRHEWTEGKVKDAYRAEARWLLSQGISVERGIELLDGERRHWSAEVGRERLNVQRWIKSQAGAV